MQQQTIPLDRRVSRMRGRVKAWLSKPANVILLVFFVLLIVLTLLIQKMER